MSSGVSVGRAVAWPLLLPLGKGSAVTVAGKGGSARAPEALNGCMQALCRYD